MILAIVRVRGLVGRNSAVEGTLQTLKLYKRNYCTTLEESPESLGMLTKVKDFITWGEVDEETLNILREKSTKKFYRLNSPKKGFGRKGIKYPFNKGGALGNRKEKINDLIKRMM